MPLPLLAIGSAIGAAGNLYSGISAANDQRKYTNAAVGLLNQQAGDQRIASQQLQGLIQRGGADPAFEALRNRARASNWTDFSKALGDMQVGWGRAGTSNSLAAQQAQISAARGFHQDNASAWADELDKRRMMVMNAIAQLKGGGNPAGGFMDLAGQAGAGANASMENIGQLIQAYLESQYQPQVPARTL